MTLSTIVTPTDSVEEWIHKTNLLIGDLSELKDDTEIAGVLASQFRYAKDMSTNTVAVIEKGILRDGSALSFIDEQSITLPSVLSMIYIDLATLDTQPIKAMSVLGGPASYEQFTVSSEGQTTFTITTSSPLPEYSVWLDEIELEYITDYTFSGLDIVLTNNRYTAQIGSILTYCATNYSYFDALENIVTLHKVMQNSNTDFRSWAIINKVGGVVIEDIPLEHSTTVTIANQLIFGTGTRIKNGVVYKNGKRLIQNVDYIVGAPTRVKFAVAPDIGDELIFSGFSPATGFSLVSLTDEVIASTPLQTVFTFTQLPVHPRMALWIDGVRYDNDEFVVDTVTNQITLSTGVASGTKVFAGTLLFSDYRVYFIGGTAGQIPRRNSSTPDDWSWVTPSFNADVFTSGIFDAARIPLTSNILTPPSMVSALATPFYVKLNTWVDAWRTHSIGSYDDWLITGQSRNAIRGINASGVNYTNADGRPFNEFYVSQKYGRIIKNPIDSLESSRDDVPNAPFSVNGIATCRVSTDVYTLATLPPIDFLFVVGDKANFAYSKNVVPEKSAKGSIYDTWTVLTTNPFGTDWDFIDVVSIMASGNTLSATTTDVIEYVFVSAYNKTTNKSSVIWKPAAEVTNESLPWRQYAPFNNTDGVTGKITKFGGVPKIWGGNGTSTSTAVVHFAVGEYVYQISNYDLPFNPYMSGVYSTDYPARIFPNQGATLTFTVDAGFNFTTNYYKTFSSIPLSQTYPFAGQNIFGILLLEDTYSFYAVQKDIATGVEKLLVRDVDFAVRYQDAGTNNSTIQLLDYSSPSPTNSKFYGSTITVSAHKILRQRLTGETITGIYGFTTKSRSTGTKTEERFWFATTESGKIYRKTTQLAEYPATTTPTGWTQIALCPYGKVTNISAIGEVCANGVATTTLRFLAFFEGGCAEFDYSAAASENIRLSRTVKFDGVPSFVSFFADHSDYSTTTASVYTSNLIAQNEKGVLSRLNADYASSSVGAVKQVAQEPFIKNDGFVPPTSFHVVVSDGITRVCVSKAPVNCVWVIKGTKSGGSPIPMEGDILGGFYEQGRFIIVTIKFIYSSADAVTWTKFPYVPNFDNRDTVDISSAIINGVSMWVLANNDDSAASYDGGINWVKQVSPRANYKMAAAYVTGFGIGFRYFSGGNSGAIFGKQYKGSDIGFLYPYLSAGVHYFNVRNPAMLSSDVNTISIRGYFRNGSPSAAISQTKQTHVLTVSTFEVNTTPSSPNYGSIWKLTGTPVYMVDGYTYEIEIDDGSSSGLVFPYHSITSDVTSAMISVDQEGYLIYCNSENGLEWLRIDSGTNIDVIDGATNTVVGSIDLQYDGVTEDSKYTSVQYSNAAGFLMARKSGHIVALKNIFDIKEYIAAGTINGLVDNITPFADGDYITDMYGKNFVFAVTVSGKIWLMTSSVIPTTGTPAQWFKLNNPIHSDNVPSNIAYDGMGNYFLADRTINSKTGDLPQYNDWKY